MKDQYRNLSEQDYGCFLEVATIEEEDNQIKLSVSAGYGPDNLYDSVEYLLSARPALSLAEAFRLGGAFDAFLDPNTDQSADLATLLGVDVRQAD